MSGNCRSSGGRSRPRPSWRLCSRASGCSTWLPAREPCRERSPRGGPVPGRRWDWTAPPRCLRSPPHAYRLIGRFSGATPSASRLRIRASTSSAPATCFTCSARTTDAESSARWRVCSALAGDWSRSPRQPPTGHTDAAHADPEVVRAPCARSIPRVRRFQAATIASAVRSVGMALVVRARRADPERLAALTALGIQSDDTCSARPMGDQEGRSRRLATGHRSKSQGA
jgi:hypothetical protein